MRVSALCIGHAAWDLCMQMEAYPAENSKTETDRLIESGGGPAANAAWLLRRWGVPTAFAALVGKDNYGRKVVKELADAGIDCRLVEQRAGHVTPLSFVIANGNTGSRTIINRKVPAASLQLTHRRLSRLDPQVLLFDGHELPASLAAMEAFPSAVTVLDAGSLREGTATLAPKVRYLVCSEKFAAQATGETGVSIKWRPCLRRLRLLYGSVVVVTLGANGCVFDDGKHQGRLPALRVNAVDTTAAGDIFHGAFAFGLLKGLSLEKVLRLATVAAGLSVQNAGGRPSTPELKAVADRLRRLKSEERS
ncbi:MAG TPA: PfkB family carbohydrate kinase [Verrucomicrobiae bacterium]